jgi:hypothetical protein
MNCWKSCLFAALAASAVFIAAPFAAAQSIVGDTIDVWGVAQSNGSEYLHASVQVVDPGVEFTQSIIGDIYDLDFGPSTITLNNIDDWYSPWFNSGHPPTRMEFRGIDVPGMPGLSIGGISVLFSDTIVPEDDAPVGYPAFSADNVTFTGDSVAIEIGPYKFPEGSRIQIDVTFVPEPTSAVLLGGGLIAGALFRRRTFV